MSFFIKSLFVSWLLAAMLIVFGLIIDPTMISSETTDPMKQIGIGVVLIWVFTILIEMALLLVSRLFFMIREDIKEGRK